MQRHARDDERDTGELECVGTWSSTTTPTTAATAGSRETSSA